MGDIQLSSLGLEGSRGQVGAGIATPTPAANQPGLGMVSYSGAPAASPAPAPAPEPTKPAIVELHPGMRGFFVPGKFIAKDNDSAKTPRQLFVQLDDDGNEKGTYYLDPKGKFKNMLDEASLEEFVADPDTFDQNNPSGFDEQTFNVLQAFRGNPQGLRDYAKHTGFSIYKQETAR
ncbi:hypothetical protein LJR296_001453 [Cupriavidus necator]|uniref:hypothetical protein n=1 Tax=Cupriavidus necator TaxID=106590 RepID=UPI003ECC6EA5